MICVGNLKAFQDVEVIALDVSPRKSLDHRGTRPVDLKMEAS